MIINDYPEAVDALKEAYHWQTECLILDLDESLNAIDVVYAFRKCPECGSEGLVSLGMDIQEKCLCGYNDLDGYTADMVVQGHIVMWNYERDMP